MRTISLETQGEGERIASRVIGGIQDLTTQVLIIGQLSVEDEAKPLGSSNMVTFKWLSIIDIIFTSRSRVQFPSQSK